MRVRYRSEGRRERTRSRASHTISTIPLGRLVQIVDPIAPSEVVDAAKGLEFRCVRHGQHHDRQGAGDPGHLALHPRAEASASPASTSRRTGARTWRPPARPRSAPSGSARWATSSGRCPTRRSSSAPSATCVEDLGFLTRDEIIGGFALKARNAYPVYTLDYNAPRSHPEGLPARSSPTRSRSPVVAAPSATTTPTTRSRWASSWDATCWAKSHDVDSVNLEDEYHEEKRVES